jgi:four helix bundle protein
MFQSFEDLDVWKRACGLAVKVYEALRLCRDFGLRNQMQRAAVSIASNIAEGAERSGRDFARFLTIARGSAAELRTQTYIAARVGSIDKATMASIVNETKELSKMLFALGKTLKPQPAAEH